MRRVFYEMNVMTEVQTFTEKFSIEYDREEYDSNSENLDAEIISYKWSEIVEKYGIDAFLVSYSIEREL
ncbi:hypothetical protein COD76_11820 [Bacillus cereus]|nr:hypothetical protein COL80_15615 [Bacillus thuringiensis]PGU82169.1 hypothetical protein COD76_11820 [Bacillus cereus]